MVIAKYWGIRHHCTLYWTVDSQAAISKVSINIQPGAKPCCQPDEFNLLAFLSILKNERLHPLKITWIKKGNQDKTTDYDKLSHHAQMNVNADSLATQHFQQPSPQLPFLYQS
jgi:hypothetical protein